MQPDAYQAARDQLLAILSQVLDLKGLPERTRKELQAIQRKCQEDQFEVALVGAFQGGKSTTFNALCDGRDISPRGLSGGGIKTSAGVITVQHNSNANERRDGLDEWAEVTWRDHRSLLLGMVTVVRQRLLQQSDFVQRYNAAHPKTPLTPACTDEHVAECLDLRVEYHRDAIRQAIKQEWASWHSNRTAYDPDRLDLLRMATLQMRFLDDPKLKALQQRSVFPIPDVQRMIVFPIDWLQRWGEGEKGAESFTPETAGFAFIDRVLLRIRSANLSRIGCRVTDCPGLFVSSWDTMLAQEVMARSDAIWFLIGGDKSLTQEAGKIIDFIRDRGWQRKLFLTVNLRGDQSHEQMLQTIVPAIAEQLKARGINIAPKPYDAFLAFRSMQGKLLLEHPERLSDYDRTCLAKEGRETVPPPNLPRGWTRLVRKRCEAAELPVADDLQAEALQPKIIEELRRCSFFDDILQAVETRVITDKAHAILIENGSKPAIAALKEVEGSLAACEQQSKQKAEQFRAEVQEQRRLLERFRKHSDDNLRPLTEEALDLAVFQNFWEQVVEGSVEPAAVAAARAVAKLWEDDDPSDAKVQACISNAYHQQSQAAMVRWVDALITGQNLTFQVKVVDRAKQICLRIEREWDDSIAAVSKGHGLLAGIRLPNVAERLDSSAMDLRKLWHEVTFRSFDAKPLLPQGFWDHFKVFFGIRPSPEKITTWEREITMRFQALLAQERPRIQQQVVPQLLRPLREAYVRRIRDGLDLVEQVFAERCKEAEQRFQLAEQERQRIAAEAHAFRTQRIQPLRERLEAFERSVQTQR